MYKNELHKNSVISKHKLKLSIKRVSTKLC